MGRNTEGVGLITSGRMEARKRKRENYSSLWMFPTTVLRMRNYGDGEGFWWNEGLYGGGGWRGESLRAGGFPGVAPKTLKNTRTWSSSIIPTTGSSSFITNLRVKWFSTRVLCPRRHRGLHRGAVNGEHARLLTLKKFDRNRYVLLRCSLLDPMSQSVDVKRNQWKKFRPIYPVILLS